MKYILFVFYILGFLVRGNILCDVPENRITYILPEGFTVINAWEDSGVLSVSDDSGNGVDIYINDGNVDISDEISLLRQEWGEFIVKEEFIEGGHLINVDSGTVIYPVDSIVILQNNGFLVKAFFLKPGDPHTHGAFEQKAMKLLRSIAQGGRDEKTLADCIRSFTNPSAFR